MGVELTPNILSSTAPAPTKTTLAYHRRGKPTVFSATSSVPRRLDLDDGDPICGQQSGSATGVGEQPVRKRTCII